MIDCLFCKMISGAIPVKPVYEDEDVFVIDDINPQAPLHALVIPKRHIATLNELSADDDALVGAMVLRGGAAVAAERGFAGRGFRTVFNTNAESGQSVFHIHLHVLGGRSLTWPP